MTAPWKPGLEAAREPSTPEAIKRADALMDLHGYGQRPARPEPKETQQ